ncbi:MAG: DNA methyltransferase [Gammaproteobacteria bacterium]
MTRKSNGKKRELWIGDNLTVMRGMNSDSVDLIYLDPPFNSKKQYQGVISINGKERKAQFKDTWTVNDITQDEYDYLEERCPDAAVFIKCMGGINGEDWEAYLTFMGARLWEMRRLLKDTGSIYLHCDKTMAHGLKLLMDCVFGGANFLNHIAWQYDGPQSPSKKKFATKHDDILRYAKNAGEVYVDYDELFSAAEIKKAELESAYKKDEGGYFYDLPPGDYSAASIAKLKKEGRVRTTKNGKTRIKYYLIKKGGKYYRRKKIPTVWNDISSLGQAGGGENTKWPTQKPLALLNRIIRTSGKKGDVLLDPFCGCATACVAAAHQERQWVGIDLELQAAAIMQDRMRSKKEKNLLDEFHKCEIRSIVRQPAGKTREQQELLEDLPQDIEWLKTPPRRTDVREFTASEKAELKPALYHGQQKKCAGCLEITDLKHLDLDRKIPQKRGGYYVPDNVQLLCGNCNRTKGGRTNAYLQRKLEERDLEEFRKNRAKKLAINAKSKIKK